MISLFELYLRLDIYVFSLLLVTVLGLSLRARGEVVTLEIRLFEATLAALACMLVLDSLAWFFRGRPDSGAVVLAVNSLYYLLHPVPAVLYALFSGLQCGCDQRRIRLRAGRFAALVGLNALLVSANLKTGWYFTVDAANIYRRGPYYPVFAVIVFLPMVYSLLLVLLSRKTLERWQFRSLLAFPVAPMLGGLLQNMFYGTQILWPVSSLAGLIVFVTFQNRRLSLDYLTGAYNRRRLDEYVEHKIRLLRPQNTFCGFLLDLDDFKIINDNHGHAEGDTALIKTVELLRSCLRADDFIARYAGDEFVVIIENTERMTPPGILERFQARLDEYNRGSGRPYQLLMSIGTAVYDHTRDGSAGAFLRRLDAEMYMEKYRRKNAGYR